MLSRRSTRVLLLTLLWIVLFLSLTAGTVAAAPVAGAAREGGERVCIGESVIGLQGGCGDGICDPYMNEDAATCPEDCASQSAFTITPVRWATRTPTPTTTPTPSATPTPEKDTPTPSETPIPDEIETGSLATLPGCGLVAYESRAQAWQKGYGGAVSPGAFVPERTDNREIYVCEVPPVGELCIPIYQGLLQASQEDIANIVLVDCSVNGACQIFEGPRSSVEDSICFVVTQADALSCSAGCALAPRQVSQFVLPLLSNVPFRVLAPSACLISLLFFGVALGIVFVARRSRSRGGAAARIQAPLPDWDIPLRSTGAVDENGSSSQGPLPS